MIVKNSMLQGTKITLFAARPVWSVKDERSLSVCLQYIRHYQAVVQEIQHSGQLGKVNKYLFWN